MMPVYSNPTANQSMQELIPERSKKENPINLVFKDICYEVEVTKESEDFQLPCCREKETKHILKNVSGICKAG